MIFVGQLLIIDGHAYAYRAFYAIRGLRGGDGRPTNAIFGFIKTLEKMVKLMKTQGVASMQSGRKLGREAERGMARESGQGGVMESGRAGAGERERVAVVWDGGLSGERLALLPEYKAQRPEMPEDLRVQFDPMVEYLRAVGVCSLCRDGIEADDYIASLARQAERAGMAVVIASADKDFMQLVSPAIGLLNPNDKSNAIWTRVQVREKTGVEPEQIVDWLSLMGDAVDNIPGVPGVGPKTATELLGKFGTVEGLLARLDEVRPEGLRARLTAAAGNIRRNLEMVRLRDDLACEVPPMDCVVREPARDKLRELYGRWGFKGMLASLDAAAHEEQQVLI
jgi:DNA polymerase I